MTTVTTSDRTAAADAVLFGVVRFAPGGSGLVQDTMITFRSAEDADSFAVERGWSDYQVCPLRFFVDDRPADRGDWMVIGEKLEHLVNRRTRRTGRGQ